ncbi:ribokinase [Malassezia nana]|uniref:Ribokinase n=1 Tax=Malassezia nana TaxID=180528 RepID=A0AAF0ENZ7_9BASI|nr:ribokinase [Malassezia nana]
MRCLVRSSVNIDETFQVPHIVRPGETMSSTHMWSRPGGKGANVAAALGLAGVQVSMLGAVGHDATWPLDELRKRSVNVDSVHISKEVPTGRAFIQIAEDGENAIVLLPGANYAPADRLDDPSAWLDDDVTHLVLQNEIPLATTEAFVRYARTRSHVATVFNPSPMLTTPQLQAFPWDSIDVLIVNEGEATDMHEARTGQAPGAHPAQALAQVPAFSSIAWIIVTRGSHGSSAGVLIGGERVWVDVAAAATKHVVNTTGAGDTFTGYLVSGLMHISELTRDSVQAVLTRASLAAAMAVEVDGAMESIPTAEAVERRATSGGP